jgi:uncharacterized protein YebE (UPF0316 family)
MILPLPDTALFTYAILPLLIFFARILDVSIGTMRIIFTARGFRALAPLLGFFEVLIWLVAIEQILTNMTNLWCYLAYGAGFATGTYVGIRLEDRLSVGKVLLRIITKRDATELFTELKNAGFAETAIDADGPAGKVKLIFMVLQRKHVQRALDIVHLRNPKAFYSIEDVRYASEPATGAKMRPSFHFFRWLKRK